MEVRQTLLESRARDHPQPPVALSEPRPRRPQLHRKTHLIASRQVLEALAVDATVVDLIREQLVDPDEAIVHPTESGPLIHQRRLEPALRLPRRFDALLDAGRFDEPVLYFMTGSMNKNVRSMAPDGEVTAIISGAWTLQAYLDFAMLSGSVAWIDDLDEMERLLPPYPRLRRWIGRWLQYVL